MYRDSLKYKHLVSFKTLKLKTQSCIFQLPDEIFPSKKGVGENSSEIELFCDSSYFLFFHDLFFYLHMIASYFSL